MQLVLRVHGAIAQEHIADVANIAILDLRRMRTANDVYVVAYRELAHKGAEAVGIFWYFFDGRCRCPLFPLDGQQFKSEDLRKDHDIGVVIGCHVRSEEITAGKKGVNTLS